MGVLGINHVTVLVSDIERAKAFYVDVLGLEPFPVGKSFWAKAGGQFLHITNDSGVSVKGSFYHFALEVEEFDNYIQQLISKGIEVFDLDKELNKVSINSDLDKQLRQYFVSDPDGNLVELIDSQNEFYKMGLD